MVCIDLCIFMIDLVDLTGDGKKDVFVVGEGRGNSVRQETLGVFEVDYQIKSGA